MCTLHDFSVLKSNLFIRALLLDRILVTEKTTRTPRVHLVDRECPKPRWHVVTSTSLSHYKLTLDELLCKLDIPDDVLSCSNLFCEVHTSFISSLHEHIVSSLVTAAQE